jgi:putative monooxygenase
LLLGVRAKFWTYATVDATRTMLATGETKTIDAEHGHAKQ